MRGLDLENGECKSKQSAGEGSQAEAAKLGAYLSPFTTFLILILQLATAICSSLVYYYDYYYFYYYYFYYYYYYYSLDYEVLLFI